MQHTALQRVHLINTWQEGAVLEHLSYVTACHVTLPSAANCVLGQA